MPPFAPAPDEPLRVVARGTRRDPQLSRRRWRTAALLAVVAWAALGFGRAAAEATRGWQRRDRYVTAPAFWRFGAPQTERLQRCLESSAGVIPADSAVGVVSGRPDLYFWRWAAYLLADRDVLPGPGPEPAPAAYLVTFGPHPPLGRRVRGGQWCAVYRLSE